MPALPETARAYLDALEADRQAALALSKQKAEEAKLIRARQEGFQAAMEMLGSKFAAEPAGTDPQSKEPVRRRGRRPIRDMILRELMFTGRPMTTARIASAVNYIPERTETALERMEKAGQVVRNEGCWTTGTTLLTYMNGHAVRTGKSRQRPEA